MKVVRESSLGEITLRKYEKPYQFNKRELARKICLSLGLVQPADSRDIVVYILLTLIEARNEKKELNLEKIKKRAIEIRKGNNIELKGIADSNIRRQLKKLRDLFLVEKIANNYRITGFENLEKIFEDKIEKFYVISIIERIKEYLREIEKNKDNK
jgi:DNA-binding transcriptional ArsR family regulator